MVDLCPKCKTENAAESKFCNACGLQLESVDSVLLFLTKTLQTPVQDLEAGTTIAEKYKLIDELGREGMGVVFLAEQIAPVRRKVAVKIIKLGVDTKQVMARFEAERQALAIMDHPSIAKVYNAGATETERMMCTEMGQLIGTPEYMSPEQAEMTGLDIDTRTDINSLGVLLYEPLVGALPFDSDTLRAAGLSEIQRIIRETVPPNASTRLSSLEDFQTSIVQSRSTDLSALRKELKGELDAAEPIFREILDIDRKLFGDDDLNVAIDLNNLGNLMRDKGDYEAINSKDEAEKYRLLLLSREH
jgi:serine/threonine protein kinase